MPTRRWLAAAAVPAYHQITLKYVLPMPLCNVPCTTFLARASASGSHAQLITCTGLANEMEGWGSRFPGPCTQRACEGRVTRRALAPVGGEKGAHLPG